MKYADMAVPSRALHLWRYTPWARIHPSKVDEVPDASAVRFGLLEGGELVEGAPRIVNAEDIGRVFLSELGGSAWTLETDGKSEVIHVQAVASGHVAVGHLHLVLKHNAAQDDSPFLFSSPVFAKVEKSMDIFVNFVTKG